MQKKGHTLKQTTDHRQAHQSTNKATRITPMQRELLDMFAHQELSDQEMAELKDMLSDYLLDKAQNELEILAQQEEWDIAKKAEQWGNEKLRTPYRRDRRS